jgi:hypothetical protein
MPEKSTHDNRPYWVWSVPRSVLNLQHKHFYCYFCFLGTHASHEWNCRLARRFHVSRSTIKSWLRVLRELRLVWITSGRGKHRRIHARHYATMLDWFTRLAIPKVTLKDVETTKKRSAKTLSLRRVALLRQIRAISSLTGQKTVHNIL